MIIGLLGFYGLFSAGELADLPYSRVAEESSRFMFIFHYATVRKHELYKVNVSKTVSICLCSFVLNGFLMLSFGQVYW